MKKLPTVRVLAKVLAFALTVVTVSCSKNTVRDQPIDHDAMLLSIADEYYEEFNRRYPNPSNKNEVAVVDRLTDNSLKAIHSWEELEAKWFNQIKKVDINKLDGNRISLYGLLSADLEASSLGRSCKYELMNVNHYTGWHVSILRKIDRQPILTVADKKNALKRWGNLPKYVDVEISKLKQGVKSGYTSPKSMVNRVLGQLDKVLNKKDDESPYLGLSLKSDDQQFQKDWAKLVNKKIIPSMSKFRRYLRSEYLDKARDSISISEVPNGRACYLARINNYTSLDISPKEISMRGQKFEDEMNFKYSEITNSLFGTDIKKEVKKITEQPEYMFKSREEMISTAKKYLERSKELSLQWFHKLPDADLVLERIPEANEKGASRGRYLSASLDGKQPAKFLLNTYEPTKIRKYVLPRLVFHEGIPGHHLQFGLALESGDEAHPIQRLLSLSVFTEGWAIYGELLAEEYGSFESDIDRLGLIGNRVYAYMRTKFEMDVHLNKWSRQDAIKFLKTEQGYSQSGAEWLVDRITAIPAQTMSYLIGSLEFRRLKNMARDRLGDKFDIKDFHFIVLKNGSVSLNVLNKIVEDWIVAQK